MLVGSIPYFTCTRVQTGAYHNLHLACVFDVSILNLVKVVLI